jgi:bifunctional ADP-heptose synthase (sugar kinase/adenylyltransferase)
MFKEIPTVPSIYSSTWNQVLRSTDYRSKIIEMNELPIIRKTFNCPISFLTGCFDSFHRGYDSMLEQARGYVGPNGIVVVGINSDLSVKLQDKKDVGLKRPINFEYCRLHRIASHPCVDFTYLFDDKTAVSALELLKPDVFMVFSGDNLRDKPEIVYICESLPNTVLRVNTDIPYGQNGEKISTSRLIELYS